MKKSSFLQTHNQVFKILNLIVLILGLSYQTKAQEYKLVVGNKTPCVLMVQSGLCNNAPGLTFYVPPMTQVEQIVTGDRKSTRLNSSHVRISYAVFCLKKK